MTKKQVHMTTSLFEQVTAITEDYLGPAAERFVSRQITFHLRKDPLDLNAADIPKLVEWTKVTLGLITEDRQMVDDYAIKINELVREQ
jgi:hypothetical protein